MEVYGLASIIIVIGLSTTLLAAYYPIRMREEIKDVEGKEDGEAVVALIRTRMFLTGAIEIVSGILIMSETVDLSLVLLTMTISVMAMVYFSNYYLVKRYNYRLGVKVRE